MATRFTMIDLERIEAAIASGARSIGTGSDRVEYNSLNDMLRVRSIIMANLGLSASKSSTILTAHSRGSGPNTDDDNFNSGF